MKLYLMRHGEAAPVGRSVPDDGRRPLTSAGKLQVRKVAEGLRRHIPVLDAVVTSPLQRAAETAHILAEVLGVTRVEASPNLAPSSSAQGIRALLKTYGGASSLMLVGHHPDITVLTAMLTGLDPSACPLFGTASVAALELDSGKQKADFLWFQTSEQLASP